MFRCRQESMLRPAGAGCLSPLPVVIHADGSRRGMEPPNCTRTGPVDVRGLTRIISPGTSNYGPDVDNSSNYKAVGPQGPRLGCVHSCVKAPSLEWVGSCRRAGQPHVVLISQTRLHTHGPQQDFPGLVISRAWISLWGRERTVASWVSPAVAPALVVGPGSSREPRPGICGPL